MLQILYVFGTAKYSLKPIHRGGGIFCKNYIANLSRNKAVPQQLHSFVRVGHNILLFGLGVLNIFKLLIWVGGACFLLKNLEYSYFNC